MEEYNLYSTPISWRVTEAFKRHGHYLELSKPEYASVKNYLSLSVEHGGNLLFDEFKEYSPEGAQIFGQLFLNLFEEKKIQIMKQNEQRKWLIDLEGLEKAIYAFKDENMSVAEKLHERREVEDRMGGFSYVEPGRVELFAVESNDDPSNFIGVGVKDTDGLIWSVRDMEKLAHELLDFVKNTDQDLIDKFNFEKRKSDLEEEVRMREIDKEMERVRAQKAVHVPKEGNVILFQAFPSGKYKFSYSYKLSAQGKINQIKEQYGDNINVVHVVEVADTMSFFHKFCKKQFYNRLTEDYWYDLNDEDIEFFKSEKYPPQAMEWFRG